jgi:plastocyanin
MREFLLCVSLISLLGYAGCGGGEEDDPFASGGGGTAGGGVTAPAATATIKGKISFEGEVPMARKLSTSADPKCVNPDLRAEDTVVSDGGLENVMIYVSSPVTGGFPTPSTPVMLDQMGCQYKPHVITVQVNQPIVFKNSDDTSHNIHAFTEVNPTYNQSQARKGMESTHKFAKPEIMMPVRCDVHNWMNSFIGVFAHPYHTVSATGGAYELKLPAGKYEITAHHEKYGKKTMMVEVADNGSADLNLSFSATDKGD